MKRIVLRDGAACGVVLETGHVHARREELVHAGAVVSNADMRQTVEQLIDPDRLPPDFVARIRRLRPSYPCRRDARGLPGVGQ